MTRSKATRTQRTTVQNQPRSKRTYQGAKSHQRPWATTRATKRQAARIANATAARAMATTTYVPHSLLGGW